MIRETTRSRNPAGRAGFLTNLLALANALASFFESRAALFATESKHALVQLLALVACLVAALVFFVFGYVFLLASAVGTVASLLDVPWVWVALGAAGAHFVIAFVFVLIGRSRLRRRPFPETAAELKKDREWLKNLDQTSTPTS
jgi:uncharacterized membrane protein YqjE